MIHIFLRETSHNKVHSDQFDWMNYEKCFKSLLDTLDINCKLTVIFDGHSYGHYVDKYKNNYQYKIIDINAGNDFLSNTKTFAYISQQTNIEDNDIIAVFENDYLYLPWVQDIIYLYQKNVNHQMWNNTYVSLFDHLDKLIFNIPDRTDDWGIYNKLKSQIYLGLTRQWRTVPSTCGSFLLSKEVFDKDLDIHLSGKADNSRFDILVNQKNRVVLTPIPALATHTNKYFSSPHINWRQLNENIKLL